MRRWPSVLEAINVVLRGFAMSSKKNHFIIGVVILISAVKKHLWLIYITRCTMYCYTCTRYCYTLHHVLLHMYINPIRVMIFLRVFFSNKF